METSPVGVVVFDVRSAARPLSVNREALRIVGGLRDEGQETVEDLLGAVTCIRSRRPRALPARAARWRSCCARGRTVRAEEIVLRVPDGRSISTLLNATPIPGAGR